MIEKSERQRRREASRAQARQPFALPSTVTIVNGGAPTTLPSSRLRSKPASAFSLTSSQRQALFAGRHPRITLPKGDRPFDPGEIYSVPGTRNFALGIIGIEELKDEDLLHYRVFDERPRLLRASPHGLDFDSIRRNLDTYGQPLPLTSEEEIAIAAEESAYTTSPGAALKGEPEAVSKAEQEAMTAKAHEARRQRLSHRLQRAHDALAEVEADPDFTHHRSTTRFLRNRIRKIEEEEKAA